MNFYLFTRAMNKAKLKIVSKVFDFLGDQKGPKIPNTFFLGDHKGASQFFLDY